MNQRLCQGGISYAHLVLIGPGIKVNEGYKLDEIVVTAQKRVQSAQDVPIALTTLTADQLGSQGISSTEDLAAVTPVPRLSGDRSKPHRQRGLGGNLTTIGDCGGNNMVHAPEHVVSVALNHSLPTAVGRFATALNYLHNDGYFFQPDNRLEQPS